MLEGLTILIFLQFLGEIVAGVLQLPVPGPVIGLAMLAAFALLRGKMPESIVIAGDGILKHLSLLFVPAGVGLIAFGDRILAEGARLMLVLIASTAITMAVSALTFRALAKGDPEDEAPAPEADAP